MIPLKRFSKHRRLPNPLSSSSRVRFSYVVLALSSLCFAAAFLLSYLGRAGLTQFVSAGSFLAVWASLVRTSNPKVFVTKNLLRKLTGGPR